MNQQERKIAYHAFLCGVFAVSSLTPFTISLVIIFISPDTMLELIRTDNPLTVSFGAKSLFILHCISGLSASFFMMSIEPLYKMHKEKAKR